MFRAGTVTGLARPFSRVSTAWEAPGHRGVCCYKLDFRVGPQAASAAGWESACERTVSQTQLSPQNVFPSELYPQKQSLWDLRRNT